MKHLKINWKWLLPFILWWKISIKKIYRSQATLKYDRAKFETESRTVLPLLITKEKIAYDWNYRDLYSLTKQWNVQDRQRERFYPRKMFKTFPNKRDLYVPKLIEPINKWVTRGSKDKSVSFTPLSHDDLLRYLLRAVSYLSHGAPMITSSTTRSILIQPKDGYFPLLQ